ncbi:EamA family transporter [Comamonas serinivorans]|uniref:EamA family transporter n=1 Tax=Comamonas serinivorans TaxID=1082851 RepID=A0A1Y0ELA9_9BURK|nr:DMT family transporter [Comamonas serinivorans]ARU04423.1 EamA family transporter [Comamonas serinivorans]
MSALTGRTALLLTLPPLFWAGNAVVGRMLASQVSPISLNFMRWLLAGLVLLPLAGWVLKPGSGLWTHWRRFSLLGLLGVGCYNAFQYLALRTSSPVNVTLVASSMPLWMMLIGRLFFQARITRRQLASAALSITGVLFVLSRGQWSQLLALKLVPGDLYILVAAACWAGYSWLLVQRREPEAIRGDWAAMLLGQIVFGLMWSGAASGLEWAAGQGQWHWNTGVLAAMAFLVVCPSVLAYACWGKGVELAGPTLASFFTNLTPVFAAILSTLVLGDPPRWYHVVAFAFIVCGIALSARR